MAYCSESDILNIIPEQELINLTNDDVTDTNPSINEVQLNAAIAFAENLINGFLRGKYQLPLKNVPEFISKTAADIAVYRLYLRRPQDLPDHIKENYKMAVSLLDKIQKGQFILDTPAENSNNAPLKPTFKCNKTRQNKIFNPEMLNAFGLGWVKR